MRSELARRVRMVLFGLISVASSAALVSDGQWVGAGLVMAIFLGSMIAGVLIMRSGRD